MPATPIGLPSVLESFNRAMLAILKPIFTGGNSLVWNEQPVNFYDCDLIWNLKTLFEPRPKMMIAFIGNRSSNGRNEKCSDPLGKRRYAYQRREKLFRTVYIGVGKKINLTLPPYSLPNITAPSGLEDCDRVWSHLAWAFKHELASFEATGIFQPDIPFVPVEYPHTDYWVLTGQFSCEIRFMHTVGN